MPTIIFVNMASSTTYTKEQIWKSNDGTNVMDKHDKAYKKVQDRLINSTKRKIIDVLAECCAIDSLPFNIVNGVGFQELTGKLIKLGRQLGPGVSINDLLPDDSTINRQIDKIYDFRKE
ncbi:unnamed protein product [Adineta ricciae]|uniref:Hermes trasposase DNA-binding domain-containing protein n=1 Tax=Adineta ricciae TaxID=249248 RepID=A0A815REV5_ADIRI|nr:unnamed protein product [Adineta ricciae]